MLRHPRRNLRGLPTVCVVLFVKFRVRRRPLFAYGGMAKPEGGRRRFHGGRGDASKPAVESTVPIAGRRFALPPVFVVARSAAPQAPRLAVPAARLAGVRADTPTGMWVIPLRVMTSFPYGYEAVGPGGKSLLAPGVIRAGSAGFALCRMGKHAPRCKSKFPQKSKILGTWIFAYILA